jgi:hypothetical protein
MMRKNQGEQVRGLITWRRRLGRDPHEDGATSSGCAGCPDVWELGSGDFAVIGEDITGRCVGALPTTASCEPDERIVRLPRKTLDQAKRDIPDAL